MRQKDKQKRAELEIILVIVIPRFINKPLQKQTQILVSSRPVSCLLLLFVSLQEPGAFKMCISWKSSNNLFICNYIPLREYYTTNFYFSNLCTIKILTPLTYICMHLKHVKAIKTSSSFFLSLFSLSLSLLYPSSIHRIIEDCSIKHLIGWEGKMN